jgi:DNA-binding CsgD family transcriptional regulator
MSRRYLVFLSRFCTPFWTRRGQNTFTSRWIEPTEFVGKTIDSILSDHEWNRVYMGWTADEGNLREATVTYCEIKNGLGDRFKLELLRQAVVDQNQPVGSIAIGRIIRSLPPIQGRSEVGSDPFLPLSKGEMDVVELVIRGEMNRDIATKLNIAVRTVEARRAKAMERLRVTNLAQLVMLWCRHHQAD